MPWGQRIAHIKDPDGNAVNLTQQLQVRCVPPDAECVPVDRPGSGPRGTEERPDTDDRNEPGGTPSLGAGNLTATPATPGDDHAGTPTAAPGTYEAGEAEQERGKAVKPGN